MELVQGSRLWSRLWWIQRQKSEGMKGVDLSDMFDSSQQKARFSKGVNVVNFLPYQIRTILGPFSFLSPNVVLLYPRSLYSI